jgi:hypothetical protein
MRCSKFKFLLVGYLISLTLQSSPVVADVCKDVEQGSYIVKYKNESDNLIGIASASLSNRRKIAERMYIVNNDNSSSNNIAIATLSNDIEYIEPVCRRILPKSTISMTASMPLTTGKPPSDAPANFPNDTYAVSQWGLFSTKTGGRVGDIDVGVLPVWEELPTNGPIIAVIDSGVTLNLKEFDGVLFTNKMEKAGNGIDDDNNGYIDDINGVDIIKKNRSGASDGDSHGTAVSSVIAGKSNNGYGIAGTNPLAKILPIQIFRGDITTDAYLLEALGYVANLRRRGEDIRVVNLSLGGDGNCPNSMREMFLQLNSLGVLVVVAAGNDGLDVDKVDNFPSSCVGLPNLISVGAIGPDGNKPNWSNYGVQRVDIAAPGESIAVAGITEGTWSMVNGTSFSSPFVAGVAGILFSLNSNATPAVIKQAIIEGSNVKTNLNNLVKSKGIVNAKNSVDRLFKLTPQPQPTPNLINKDEIELLKYSVRAYARRGYILFRIRNVVLRGSSNVQKLVFETAISAQSNRVEENLDKATLGYYRGFVKLKYNNINELRSSLGVQFRAILADGSSKRFIESIRITGLKQMKRFEAIRNRLRDRHNR